MSQRLLWLYRWRKGKPNEAAREAIAEFEADVERAGRKLQAELAEHYGEDVYVRWDWHWTQGRQLDPREIGPRQ